MLYNGRFLGDLRDAECGCVTMPCGRLAASICMMPSGQGAVRGLCQSLTASEHLFEYMVDTMYIDKGSGILQTYNC